MKTVNKTVSKDKIKRFDFVKKANYFSPMRYIAKIAAKIVLGKADIDITYENMEGLKPPYFMLSNHNSVYDMALSITVNHPHRVYNVVALDGLYDFSEGLMRSIGTIAKRKFIKDITLLKNMKYVITHRKDAIVMMYPEAKYSLHGCTSYLPPSLGKLAKFLGVPVVTVNLNGCYVNAPQWHKEFRNKNGKFAARIKQTITAEELKTLSEDELNAKIVQDLQYDDFKWQKDNNVIIDLPNRAERLNSILYKCPNCGVEHKTVGKGIYLECTACGKKWEMTELGEMKALEGETEYSHIPDWFNWEKACVEEEVKNGTYYFEDEVRVKTMPNAQKMYRHPNGRLVHDLNGFSFKGTVYGEPVDMFWASKTQDGVHIEYPIKNNDFTDCVILYTQDESYYFMPTTAKDVITKISLANDAIYALKNGKL